MPPIVFEAPLFQLVFLLAAMPLLVCTVVYGWLILTAPDDVKKGGDIKLCFYLNECLSTRRARYWKGLFKLLELLGILFYLRQIWELDQATLTATMSQIIIASLAVLDILNVTKGGIRHAEYETIVFAESQKRDDGEKASGDGKATTKKKTKKTRDAYKPPSMWRTLLLPAEKVVLTESMGVLHALLNSSALELQSATVVPSATVERVFTIAVMKGQKTGLRIDNNVICAVHPGTAAATAGLEVDDLVVEVDGEAVAGTVTAIKLMAAGAGKAERKIRVQRASASPAELPAPVEQPAAESAKPEPISAEIKLDVPAPAPSAAADDTNKPGLGPSCIGSSLDA